MVNRLEHHPLSPELDLVTQVLFHPDGSLRSRRHWILPAHKLGMGLYLLPALPSGNGDGPGKD